MPIVRRKKRNQRSEQAFGRPPGDERPAHGEIAKLAHGLWLERGGTHGRDREDWFRAEERLKAQGPSERDEAEDEEGLEGVD